MKKRTIIVFSYFVNRKYSSTKQIMDWYESMKENYLVDCNRVFVIYTDNIEVQKKLFDQPIQFVYVDQTTTQDANENRKRKFRYIKDYLNKFNPTFDYFCYVQSTARCLQKVSISELTTNNDLVIFKHCGFNGSNFKSLYGNNSGSVVELDENQCKNLVYFYASHFIARKKVLLEMCDFVNINQDRDKENGIRVSWDDETYLNYYFNITLGKNASFPISIGVKSGNDYCRPYCNNIEGIAKIEIINNSLYNYKIVVFSYFVNRDYNGEKNIREWYQSMKQYYMVEQNRKFVVYTDNHDAIQNIKEPDIELFEVDWKTTLDIEYNKKMKYKWILQFLNSRSDFDFFCYVSGNARCKGPIDSFDLLNDSDVVICKHCMCNNDISDSEGEFSNKHHPEQYFQKYIYYDESHFAGKLEAIKQICESVDEQIDADIGKNYAIGKDVFDEEYWNNCINEKLAKNEHWKVGVVDGKVYSCKKELVIDDTKIELGENVVNRKNVVIFSYFIHEKYNSLDKIMEWYKSLKWGYLTDCNRLFVIYTDNKNAGGISDRSNFLNESNTLVVQVDPNTTKDLNENLKRKFIYIQDYLDKYCHSDMDYFSFIQSNARCIQPVFLDDLIDNGDQLFCCEHAMTGHHLGKTLYDFNVLYGNNDKTCVALDRSKTNNFKYIHACHFLATRKLLERFCNFINDSISRDDKNGVSTSWHDETYFNYYINTVVLPSNERVKIKPERIFAASGQLAKLGIDVKIKFIDKKHAWWGTEITVDEVIRDRDKYDVPQVIWQFWFGDNFPSYGRIEGILSMVNINVDNIIVLEKDVEKYQVPGHPFHPAWKYLSSTHKSDYMRCYFMHFYGGGYADIKSYSRDNNWKECFDLINSNKNIYVLGEADQASGIAFPEWRDAEHARKCVCCSYFIMRKQTHFTSCWYNELNRMLDENFEKLKACWEETRKNPTIANESNQNYPFKWVGILGMIIHKLEYEQFFDEGHVSRKLKTGRVFNGYEYR